jgi:hypothetical protein
MASQFKKHDYNQQISKARWNIIQHAYLRLNKSTMNSVPIFMATGLFL